MAFSAAPALAKELVVHNGVEGVWFPTAEIAAITQRVEDQQGLIKTQDKLILQLNLQVKASSDIITTMADRIQGADEYGEAGWKMYRDEVQRNAAWYNQPVTWVIVGSIIAGGVAAAASL